MNPDPSKLRQQQHQVEESAQTSLNQDAQARSQFDSVEEIIRYDAQRTEVPEAIGERLKESIAREPPPSRSWWQRLFGMKGGSA
jgi:hypothetical protein